MPTPYAGTPVFPPSFNIPSDADPPTAASVNVGLEALGDRTMFLRRGYSGAMNWLPFLFKDSLGNTFDTTFPRFLDSSDFAFFDPTQNLWVICNSNTADKYYIGDHGFFVKTGTGVGTPPKFSFGGSVGGRTLLFNDLAVGVYCYSTPGDISAWTKATLPGIAVTAVPYDAHGAANGDCVVVGSADADWVAWTSSTGNAWTKRTILAGGFSLNNNPIRRIMRGTKPGGATRLIACTNDTAGARKGDSLFYSDDHGVTWSERTAIGFSGIFDMAYVPDLGLWAFVHGTTLHTSTDPIGGSFTSISLAGTTPHSICGMGGVLALSFQVPSVASIQPNIIGVSSDAGASFKFAANTQNPVFLYSSQRFNINPSVVDQMVAVTALQVQFSTRSV